MKHDLWYCGDLIYDFGDKFINVTRQFVSEDDKTERVNPREHKCRVWSQGSKVDFTGELHGKVACVGPYDHCKAYYDIYKDDNYMELQVWNRNKPYGTSEIEDNYDDAYYKAYEDYCSRMAEEDDGWRPGDAPWLAPGMSERDFF